MKKVRNVERSNTFMLNMINGPKRLQNHFHVSKLKLFLWPFYDTCWSLFLGMICWKRIVEGNLKKLGTKFNLLTITMGIFYFQFDCHFVRSTQSISVNWKVCNPSEYFSFFVKSIKTFKGLGQLTSLCCI